MLSRTQLNKVKERERETERIILAKIKRQPIRAEKMNLAIGRDIESDTCVLVGQCPN